LLPSTWISRNNFYVAFAGHQPSNPSSVLDVADGSFLPVSRQQAHDKNTTTSGSSRWPNAWRRAADDASDFNVQTKQCRIKVYSGMVETLQRARSSLFWQRGPARVSTVSEYEALSEWRNGQRINSARWAAMPSGRRRSDDVVVSGTG
jgi:hypothetical protein